LFLFLQNDEDEDDDSKNITIPFEMDTFGRRPIHDNDDLLLLSPRRSS
jgi:hypothetical protein